MPSRYVGTTLMAFAAVHLVVGLVLFWEWLLLIVQGGVLNPSWSAEVLAAFWFLIFSWPVGLLGFVVAWTYQKTGQLPPMLGWWLFIVPAVSLVFLPASGLWLFALFGAGMMLMRWQEQH